MTIDQIITIKIKLTPYLLNSLNNQNTKEESIKIIIKIAIKYKSYLYFQ